MMRKISFGSVSAFVLALLLLFSMLLIPESAKASSRRLFDDADLLTGQEKDDLKDRIDRIREKTGMDLVVVTIDDADGKSSMEYADDYYDENDFGTGKDADGALLLLDMDNRNIWLSTSGKAINRLTDSRIDKVLSAADGPLADGDYYDALASSLKVYEKYARGHYISALEAFVAVVLAAAAGLLFKVRVKTAYKTKGRPYAYPYRERSNFALTAQEDLFINSYVTTRVIQTSSGGGGGGSSTHTSSSGRTHGGGGHSF